MILSFKFKNFTSFREEQIIDFTVPKKIEYFTTGTGEYNILKFITLLGPNASGKTNILQAFNFIREVAINIPADKIQPVKGFIPFLLDDQAKKQPGEFELIFLVNNRKFRYYLIITTREILKEELYFYPGKKPALIFQRYNKDGQTIIEFGSKIKLSALQKNIIQMNTLPNMSVIASYSRTNYELEYLKEVYSFFSEKFLPVIFPTTPLLEWAFNQMVNDNYIKELVVELLQKADFNIKDISIMSTQIKNVITVDLKNLSFSHIGIDDKLYGFPPELESEGTIRFMGLATILAVLHKNHGFIPIDELERSIHPELFEYYLNVFLANIKNAQMIFTTHNYEILNMEDLPKNVIWFTEKDAKGRTRIYSLNEFSLRQKYYNAYKIGKLGAKPYLTNIFIDKFNSK